MNEKDINQQFQDIIDNHNGILIKIARTYCQNQYDRQDLMQEMMLQIYKSLHGYNNKFAITTFIYRICLNVAISFYRKNGRLSMKNLVLVEHYLPILENESDEKELQLNQLEQLIEELNELDKALILLYLEDKSYIEMADILGLTVTNVATKIGRIKEKLKKRFSQLNSI